MKKRKVYGLTVEFYVHFWVVICKHLFRVYLICIKQKEMSTAMKQGVISLLPKPDKDVLLNDN